MYIDCVVVCCSYDGVLVNVPRSVTPGLRRPAVLYHATIIITPTLAMPGLKQHILGGEGGVFLPPNNGEPTL